MTASLLVIDSGAVGRILDVSPTSVVDAVRTAYRLHDQAQTVVPHSTFLRFPDDTVNRIIGLPAYVGGPVHTAGMKWIASFPGNLAAGLPRASAAIVLNSMATGGPTALLEGAQISAHRTAASAALAAQVLGPEEPTGISLIGCGVINLAVLRYVRHLLPSVRVVTLHDADPPRASAFASQVPDGVSVHVVEELDEALAAHRLISFATNASAPHTGLTACRPGTVVLHISLRDLHPEALLAARNIVDDPDHVDRERTSVHLASQRAGDRGFVHATIGGLLSGRVELAPTEQVTVFSPFGLGALDIAVAEMVRQEAERTGGGLAVPW
ncbi:2,3-diaminopropionate biosynthesis protein SbnB [Streptomyces odontomachi]|uniref:2,3-diaminopropionate biosynthesis protein SbnB n=1 Tax=Streptomyces odontomachi TaxID=2944940 RepID=UPI00210CB453|nr:2,3-diaminopropionate biosynthesis protein SbnB [Streptomyces sp. ODS25]